VDTVTPRLGSERTAALAERIWNVEAEKDAGELVRVTVAARSKAAA
jgi:hypothetical protein